MSSTQYSSNRHRKRIPKWTLSHSHALFLSCLLLCPSSPFRFPSLVKCLQLPPIRTINSKEPPQQISAKRCNAARCALVALGMFECLLGLQERDVFLTDLDLLMQSLDLVWSSSDVTVINSLQTVVAKIVQIVPPPPASDLGSLTTMAINQSCSPSDIFWIRIAQV